MIKNFNKKIIIGAANFGNNYGIINSKISKKKSVNTILKKANEENINYIDTAFNYENSELCIGKYLANKNINLKIITKFSKQEKDLREQYQISNHRLNIKPWAILLHTCKDYLNHNLRKELFKLKKEKLTTKVGVSLYSLGEIKKILTVEKPDIIQFPINILDQRIYKSGILQILKEKKIEIHARSVFLKGLLYLEKNIITKKFNKLSKPLVTLSEISRLLNINLSQLSLLWVNHIKEIDKIIIGVDSKSQISENLEILTYKLEKKYFDQILKISFKDDTILNPTKWQKKF